MSKTITAIVATASIAAAALAIPKPAEARCLGCWIGAGIAAGVIGGALASQAYGYGYPAYGYGYGYPAYGYGYSAYGYGYPAYSYGYPAYGYAPAYYGYAPRRYYAPLLPLLSHLNTIRRFCRPEATPHCGYSITDLDPGLDSGLWPLGSLRGGHARKHGYCHAWRDRLGDGRPLCRIDAPNRHRLSRARRGRGRHDRRQHRLPDRSFDWDSLGRAIRQIRPAQRAAAKGGLVFVSAARRKDCLLREVRRLSSDLRGSPRGCKPYELASFPDHERPRRNLLGLTVRRRRLPVR